MFVKIINKIKRFTLKDWINLMLWVLALVFLVAFVIAAVAVNNDTKIEKETYANVLASLGTVFGISLISALFTTAIVSYLNGGKK